MPNRGWRPKCYQPKPRDIERACQRIRKTWTPQHFIRRRVGASEYPAEVPLVRLADLGQEAGFGERGPGRLTRCCSWCENAAELPFRHLSFDARDQ